MRFEESVRSAPLPGVGETGCGTRRLPHWGAKTLGHLGARTRRLVAKTPGSASVGAGSQVLERLAFKRPGAKV